MRTRLLAALLVAGTLLAGCVTSEPPVKAPETTPAAHEPDTSEAPAYLNAAADFTLALEVGDIAMLASLIAPTDDAVAREIATIDGRTVETAEVKRTWDGSLLTTTYDDVTVLTLGEVTKVVSGVSGADAMPLGLVEIDGHWRVDTVNGYPAYRRVLGSTPNGKQCLATMEAIYVAAMEKQFATDTITFPKTPRELVPEFLPKMPVCPSGGTYTVEVDEPTCSVHGGGFDDINGR